MNNLDMLSTLWPIASSVAVFWGTWSLVKYRLSKAEERQESDKRELASMLNTQSSERKEAIEQIKVYIDAHVENRKEVTDKHDKRISMIEDTMNEHNIMIVKMEGYQKQTHNDIGRLTLAIEKLANKLDGLTSTK